MVADNLVIMLHAQNANTFVIGALEADLLKHVIMSFFK